MSAGESKGISTSPWTATSHGPAALLEDLPPSHSPYSAPPPFRCGRFQGSRCVHVCTQCTCVCVCGSGGAATSGGGGGGLCVCVCMCVRVCVCVRDVRLLVVA